MKKIIFVFFILGSFLYSQQDDKVKFSGLVYLDYFYNIQKNDSTKDQNGFRFRRIFFTADFNISERLSARVRVESDGITVGEKDNKFLVYFKDVFFKYKIGKQNIFVGLIPTPFVDIEESYWGYRSVEKIQFDFRRIGATRDMGISLNGSLNEKSTINYWVMFGNNSSHGIEKDRNKMLYSQLSIKPLKILELEGEFHYAFGNNDRNTMIGRFGAFIRENMKYSGGVSTFFTSTNKAINGSEKLNSFGVSGFANFNILEDLKIFGRLDFFEPNSNSNYKNDTEITGIFGIDYQVQKNLSIIPNITFNKYENSSVKTDLTGNITVFWSY